MPPADENSADELFNTDDEEAEKKDEGDEDQSDGDDGVLPAIGVRQKCGTLHVPTRSSRGSFELQGVLSPADHEIGRKAAAKICGNKTQQYLYHSTLEYPRMFSVQKDTVQGEVLVDLDLHASIMVSFMLCYLSRYGLGGMMVWAKTCDALTKVGYFEPGEAVLSSTLVLHMNHSDVWCKIMNRIAENWKTAIKTKIALLIPSLRKLAPEWAPKPIMNHERDCMHAILRNVSFNHPCMLCSHL